MRTLVRLTLAAALLAVPLAPAHASGPGGGSCHVYWDATGVPGVDKPRLYCDY